MTWKMKNILKKRIISIIKFAIKKKASASLSKKGRKKKNH